MTGLVVAAVDGSKPATAALEWAADDARRRGAALRIVHVREPWAHQYPFHAVEGFADSYGEFCEGVLAAAAERARQVAPDLEVTTELAEGTVVETLRAASAGADALVVGSRGTGGFSGLVLGSVGLGLTGHAPVPVVVVRRPHRDEYHEVVVGFDGSPHSEAALEFAFEEARARRARVHAVYAWEAPIFSPFATGYIATMREAFEEESRSARLRLAPWREKHPDVPLVESAVFGHPVPALAEASLVADLVVVGSRGLGGVRGALLGSVSHAVLHRAHCPVAVVRPPEGTR
ncbi:universal stress protein [Microbispora triticiradicis]|uniref:Universal stress protein n=2 Tax=Microbispora TaxID=2005 RepID=A0ABY3LXF6_9ACTN|nr:MULTISPECIES: universal stress protein [Microbispora]TLP60874.1 universal stress protein [Microbispora fusca]TYB58734.1 universal stress protein [Microbispora tritici]